MDSYLEEIEVQRKIDAPENLANLERDVIFDLNVALRMFTKSIVIQKQVEDLQLGVESYQKKLNITRPETFRSDIPNKTLFSTTKTLKESISRQALENIFDML
ncbi:hypothetical protein Tco_0651927 [Tanacetum coccineum]|uniref:Uncharacterized protein n=1 Tax=Tanacetum coccineum TaxID=301880 RepID=A0ABQ4WWG1_9ASTR